MSFLLSCDADSSEALCQQTRLHAIMVLITPFELCAHMQPITTEDNLKKQRRDVEKKMTVHVQQISATQDQVSTCKRETRYYTCVGVLQLQFRPGSDTIGN